MEEKTSQNRDIQRYKEYCAEICMLNTLKIGNLITEKEYQAILKDIKCSYKTSIENYDKYFQ